MYKIEKGIPIPTHRGKNSKYPFFEMEVGDSFEVETLDKTSGNTVASIRNCYHNVCRYNENLKDIKIAIRVTSDKTVRCWRIK
jgi:sortase (surface protein transpeptidase)